MGYFEILLLIHIAGAIIGFGPTYSFAVMGPLSAKLGGPQALGVTKAMVAIEKRLVYPVAWVTQPLTGVLMIFESGRNQDFFDHEWLLISILLYVIAFYIAVFVQTPMLDKMIELAESGNAETSEFGELAKRAKIFGPVLTIALTIIVFLMIAKPGAPEGFF